MTRNGVLPSRHRMCMGVKGRRHGNKYGTEDGHYKKVRLKTQFKDL